MLTCTISTTLSSMRVLENMPIVPPRILMCTRLFAVIWFISCFPAFLLHPFTLQLDRLRELEDIVSEQDKTIAALLARCDKEKQRHGEAEASWTLSLRNLKQQMERCLLFLSLA